MTKVKLIEKPEIYEGIKVDKTTKLEYKTDEIEQTLENLVLKTKEITEDKELGYKMERNTEIYLKENDYLIFDEIRGYIKAYNEIITSDEAIEYLQSK